MKLDHLPISNSAGSIFDFSKPGYVNNLVVPEYLDDESKGMFEERRGRAGVNISTLQDEDALEGEFEKFMKDLPTKVRLNKVRNVMELNPADMFVIPGDNDERFDKFSKMKVILKNRAIEFKNKTGYDPQGALDLLDKAKYGILTKTSLNDDAFKKVEGWYHNKISNDRSIKDFRLKSEVDKLLSEINQLENDMRVAYYEGNTTKSMMLKNKRDKKIEKYNEKLRSSFINDQLKSKNKDLINSARETTDEQVIDSVLQSLDREKKADIIIGYLNSPLGKVDSDLRRQLKINDKTTNFIGFKLADPFDKTSRTRFVKTDEASVARRSIAGMSEKKLNDLIIHINEESAKDPSVASRCKVLAKQLGNTLYDVYDYADTALRIYSYFVDIRPNSPVSYLANFLKGVGKIMKAKHEIEKTISKVKSFSKDQGVETDTPNPSHYDDEKFDGDLEKEGVIHKKKNGAWGVVSKKTGYFWKQNYDSKEDAEKALKAYHSQHNFDFSFPNNIKVRIVK